MSKLIITAAALAALSLSAIAPVSAAFADTAQLRVNDLDLSTAAGKAELARRIETVAVKACPAVTTTGSRIPDREGQKLCMADVRKQIEARLSAREGRGSFGR
jgi:UrcA family protein